MSDTFYPGVKVRSIDPLDDPELTGIVVKTPVGYYGPGGPPPNNIVHVRWDNFADDESAPWDTGGLEVVE